MITKKSFDFLNSKSFMLGLALSVSTSCMQIASATPQVASFASASTITAATRKIDAEQKNKLRKAIKDAMKALAKLSETLNESLAIFSEDRFFEPDYLMQSPLPAMIDGLRAIEATMPRNGQLATLPIIGSEYLELCRQVAQNRSMAVRVQLLITQRLKTPEVFVGEASGDGLALLADMATQRMHAMAG